MPLVKRGIEPVNLSRARVAPGIQNELECVTNSTLTNVIRQLSSLSRYAEDMFSELFHEANGIFHRANQIQERVDRLKVKVTQLDSTVEEVSLQDIHMRKPFKSSVIKDHQIITLVTRPQAISEVYDQIDAPPPLDKLNPYREDGKDSRKFYTDPTYFFELWCREMQKDTEMQKKEIKRKKRQMYHVHHQGIATNQQQRPKTRPPPDMPRQPACRNEEIQKYKHGKELAENKPHPQQLQQQQQQQQQQPLTVKTASRPGSLEVQGQLPYDSQNYYAGDRLNIQQNRDSQQQHNPALSNGPVGYTREESYTPGSTGGGSSAPLYQPPPPYNQQNKPAEHYATDPYVADYQQQQQQQQQPHLQQRQPAQNAKIASPVHTPTKRGAGTPSAAVGSPRPNIPPPAPPPLGADSPMGNRSVAASRESLPPPPPPPQEMAAGPPLGTPVANHIARATPPYMSPTHPSMLRGSSTPSPQLSRHGASTTPDSADLPPPPPPPPDHMGTPDNGSLPPPPMSPPPIGAGLGSGGAPPPPPPPPPPPNLSGGGGHFRPMPNGDLPRGPAASEPALTNSNDSSVQSAGMDSMDAAPVQDARSDLLVAIRQGIDLRKVEERRAQAERRRGPAGRLDVQSIMEAAFEMRRKALEANDSDDDDEAGDDEGRDWSGED